MKRFGLFFAVMLLFAVQNMKAQNEVVDNNTVIQLLEEGFNTQEIVGLIENVSERNIVFSISYMRELKQAGAAPELISYIQEISRTDFGYDGVYWWNTEGDKPVKLHRTSFEKEQSGGMGAIVGIAGIATGVLSDSRLGAAVATGLISSSGNIEKVVMQGAQAKIVLTGENRFNPVFRFYFPKDKGSDLKNINTENGWYYAMMAEVQSPNEFQCIKMKQKKNRRSFPNGINYSVAGFTSKKSTRDIVEFQVKDISNSIFEISFSQPLEPGEYCFFYKHGVNNSIFGEHMFGFDFSIEE